MSSAMGSTSEWNPNLHGAKWMPISLSNGAREGRFHRDSPRESGWTTEKEASLEALHECCEGIRLQALVEANSIDGGVDKRQTRKRSHVDTETAALRGVKDEIQQHTRCLRSTLCSPHSQQRLGRHLGLHRHWSLYEFLSRVSFISYPNHSMCGVFASLHPTGWTLKSRLLFRLFP